MDSLQTKPISETITENLFRNYYGTTTFLEKSAIPKSYGFTSKKGTNDAGYPDFFKDMGDFVIIVEAKALKHSDAQKEVKHYMEHNTIKNKGMVGIAVSGQELSQLKTTYYYKAHPQDGIAQFQVHDSLMSLDNIKKTYEKKIAGESISDEELTRIIKQLNETFHNGNKVRDTDRSLFFSGILIALRNDDFRASYASVRPPSETERATTKLTLLEAHNLNKRLLEAISIELKGKVNNLSKEFSWRDRFAFISTIDFALEDYKKIIRLIEKKIYYPFIHDEKRDILGKAYKLFLKRAGKVENKNIILTPDHVRSLMIKLARLQVDDVVLDTCMGPGGFLMDALEVLTNLAGDDLAKIDEICSKQIIGFEIDPVLFALACSNMFLHGDGRSNLLYRSSLLHDNNEAIVDNHDDTLLRFIREQKPTKCIINPPYENDYPIRFVKQAIQYLEPNGKLIVIMPTPTLTKHQGENGLTQEILRQAKLDFVIKMPYNLFNEQGRTVNTSIFGFTKTAHHADDLVLFYNLEEDGFVSVQHKGRLDVNNQWNDIENTIVDIINNRRSIKGVSALHPIFKRGVLNCLGWREPRNSKHTLVRFDCLFDATKGTLPSSKNVDDGAFDFVTASSERKKHNAYTHDCEALVYAISAGGSLGKSQYIHGKFIASNLCLVLTPSQVNQTAYPINLKFYNWYFEAIRKQLVADLADGTSKLTIREDDLMSYYIEYIPLQEQNKFVDRYVEPLIELQRKRDQAEIELTNQLNDLL